MTEPENDAATPDSSTVSRQGFLARTAAAAAALGLGGLAVATGTAAAAEPETKAQQPRSMAGMNVVMFITDQERAIQHFPIGWAQENLPGFTELQKNGITFNNAFTNACMCSPARSTLMSGYFPAQHGVKYTLEANMPSPTYPQVPLSTSLANIATVMSAAGYNVIYKGKWHCSKPAGSTWTPADLQAYSWQRWNPDDAGANHRDAKGRGFPGMNGCDHGASISARGRRASGFVGLSGRSGCAAQLVASNDLRRKTRRRRWPSAKLPLAGEVRRWLPSYRQAGCADVPSARKRGIWRRGHAPGTPACGAFRRR